MKFSSNLLVKILSVAAISGSYVMAVQSEEIPARGPIPFTAYDQDGSGGISETEFSMVRATREAFRAAGRPAQTPAFSAFDLNADGQLNPDELAIGQKKMQQQRPGGGRGMGRGRNMPSFSEFDLNGDGKIPEEEFLKAQGQRIYERSQAGYPMRNIGNIAVFTEIDHNADGAITPDEFTAHQVQHRQEMKQY